MNKIEITLKNGYFWINQKLYHECNEQEKEFFSKFIQANRLVINRILYEKPKDVEILK